MVWRKVPFGDASWHGTPRGGGPTPRRVEFWSGMPENPCECHPLTLSIPLAGTSVVRSGQRMHRLEFGQAVVARQPDKVTLCPVDGAAVMAIELAGFETCLHEKLDTPYLIRPFNEFQLSAMGGAVSALLAYDQPPDALEHLAWVLASVLSAEPVSASGRTVQPGAHRIVRSAVRLIVDGPPRKWTIEMLAQSFKVDVSTLKRLWKAGMDCTLGAFLKEHREAMFMFVASLWGITPAQAAKAAGYETERSALEAFERRYGMTLHAFLARGLHQAPPPGPIGLDPGPKPAA